jgi:hypothetical protein
MTKYEYLNDLWEFLLENYKEKKNIYPVLVWEPDRGNYIRIDKFSDFNSHRTNLNTIMYIDIQISNINQNFLRLTYPNENIFNMIYIHQDLVD